MSHRQTCNFQKIIATPEGIAELAFRPIRLEAPGFMRLVIEHIGAGPRGGDLVSGAHYGEQHGDLMRDPEIVFEVAAGTWHPVSRITSAATARRFSRMSGAACSSALR